MSKQPVVKPKTAPKSRPFSVSKDGANARNDVQENGTDKDEEFARQLQEEMLREQEESDADLARRLQEEERSKRPPVVHPPPGRPMSATPIRQLFQTMFGLRPEALEVEAEEDESDTPAMDPDSPEAANAAAATGSSPRGLTGVTGATAGRGEGRGLAGRRAVGRSPERARRGGLARSPERPVNRGRGLRRASAENSDGSAPPDPQSPGEDPLPGVRVNNAFRMARHHRPGRRIVLHSTNPPDQNESQPNVRPIGAMRPILGEREATMNLPDNEYDPDFMVLDLGAGERQREANFINIMRDPFLLMLLLMGRDPGFMVPDDVDLSDYEALWGLAERLGEVRSRGMKEEEINKLPTRVYRRKPGSKEKEETCSICISEYKTADNVQMLQCRHEFHKECLLEWLKRNATCPICRQDVKKSS
ncbi:uncharacterized protein LOC123558059 [Mercenaria mercenaria]|uniref:uncharacterized protein LOC123558059 n=1 Tax=Mercenaria mercenaria TaxID=6596 RepID=UPI001E1DE3AB|nr:uncharacterized protein LOC123558059 [Mercenaria mercenaria]XP_045205880.1 uncharacterized protein LOC123558059 [Mercenaria mercenaria]